MAAGSAPLTVGWPCADLGPSPLLFGCGRLGPARHHRGSGRPSGRPLAFRRSASTPPSTSTPGLCVGTSEPMGHGHSPGGSWVPRLTGSNPSATNLRDKQHIRSTFEQLRKAFASARDELTSVPPELVLPDIPEQLPAPPPLDAPDHHWRTWWDTLNRLPAPTRAGGVLHRLRASLPQVLHALQASDHSKVTHNRRQSRRHQIYAHSSPAYDPTSTAGGA